MKLESILQLKELVREKDARLAAIDRRLAMLAGLVKSAGSHEELDGYDAELEDLKTETDELIAFKAKARKDIDKFYACPVR